MEPTNIIQTISTPFDLTQDIKLRIKRYTFSQNNFIILYD